MRPTIQTATGFHIYSVEDDQNEGLDNADTSYPGTAQERGTKTLIRNKYFKGLTSLVIETVDSFA
jgi:hypothetical protein